MEYKIVQNEIPENVEYGTLLSINTNNVTSDTHGFHKYPAKFIPQIPRWAINKYLGHAKGKIILDPFCGSGTTLVEAVLSGNYGIGIDIDPLSILITKVKTSKIDVNKLIIVVDWLKNNISNKEQDNFYPECTTIEHWFTKESIFKLSRLRALINKIDIVFPETKEIMDIKDLLLICFSSIIRRVSNADNESQKTYVSHTNVKKPDEVNSLFLSQLDYFVGRISCFSKNSNVTPTELHVSSSSNSYADIIKNRKIDLIITSPPYIKAIDYIYNQMVELFWIGDLFQMQTQPLQNKKKKDYLGNKNIPKQEFTNYSPFVDQFNINLLDNNLKEIYASETINGHKHAYVTFKYFSEMEKHFAETKKILKANALYVLVVGSSRVSNVYIDTASFLVSLAEKQGFKLVNKWGYKIKNRYMRFDRKGRGGFIDIDNVIVLKNE